MLALWILLILQFGFEHTELAPEVQGEHFEHDLKLVHVVFRHGARTPYDTYPKDIHVNQTYEPYGWGELTNSGKEQMYELGGFLRARYGRFLSKNLKLSEVYAQTTKVRRAEMSLQLVLASLFAPRGTDLEWNKNLNWQPVPYSYESVYTDNFLLMLTKCPRYEEEFRRVLNEDVTAEIDRNLFKELSNITGYQVRTPEDIRYLYSILKAEKEYGLELPKWTEDYFPDKLQALAERSYIYMLYNSELKRLKAGPFLKKTIDDWKSKKAGKLDTKIFVYSGHDVTVTNILLAFNVWKQQFPDFAYTAILEFSKHKNNESYGVEIFLRKNQDTPLEKLIIPGCEEFCELFKLESLLEDNIPKNWETECEL